MNSDPNVYYKKIHRMGMWMTVAAMIVFFGVPFVACLIFDIMPTMGEVFMVAGGICLIFIPMSFAEIIAETPVMGSSNYIASITGNITNIKLPACLNAIKVANVKSGTSEADAVCGVAVCVTSLVTMLMLAIGALLLVPLNPILTSGVVSTAADYVLPALFGCIILGSFGEHIGGGVVIHGRLKTMILPVIIAAALYFFIIPEQYENYQGFIAIGLLVIIYATSNIMYKKGMVVVELPEDTEDEAESAKSEDIES